MKNILKSDKLFFIGVIAVSIVVVITALLFLSSSGTSSSSSDLVKSDSNVKGAKDAKVVVVEFSDFECSACKAASDVVNNVIEEYGNKILFVYRHFPLVLYHPDSLKAAEASEAAAEQGKFWEYHDLLFDNQDKLKEEDLLKYARDLNLNIEKFKQELDSGKFKDKVEADLSDGEKLGISATPTFFINGKKYQGALSFDEFKKIIDEELAK